MSDLSRTWTVFALEAEVDAFGVSRITQTHNAARKRIAELEAENAALRERIAELEAGNAVLRAERDGYSARLDAAIKLIADILSALPPNAVKAPDGTIYEFDPPPEYAMQMLRAFKAGIDAAIREGR